jgi:hypothetical protein
MLALLFVGYGYSRFQSVPTTYVWLWTNQQRRCRHGDHYDGHALSLTGAVVMAVVGTVRGRHRTTDGPRDCWLRGGRPGDIMDHAGPGSASAAADRQTDQAELERLGG